MTDIYGCVQYQFIEDAENDQGDLPAINLAASWTSYNTYWNPFEKGQYSHNYLLYADLDGRMFDRILLSNTETFSYILDTDYETYFVEYACKQ